MSWPGSYEIPCVVIVAVPHPYRSCHVRIAEGNIFWQKCYIPASAVLGLAACHPTANSWFLAAVLGLAACHPNSEQGAGEGRTFGPPFLKMLGVSVCFCVGKAGYYFEHSGKLRLLAQQQMGVSRVFLIALKDTSIAGRWPLAWQWRSPECF